MIVLVDKFGPYNWATYCYRTTNKKKRSMDEHRSGSSSAGTAPSAQPPPSSSYSMEVNKIVEFLTSALTFVDNKWKLYAWLTTKHVIASLSLSSPSLNAAVKKTHNFSNTVEISTHALKQHPAKQDRRCVRGSFTWTNERVSLCMATFRLDKLSTPLCLSLSLLVLQLLAVCSTSSSSYPIWLVEKKSILNICCMEKWNVFRALISQKR